MVADANTALEEAKRHAEVAATAAQAWKVLDTVIDEVTAASDRARLQRQLEEADRQDAPLRAARDQAAGELAARLDDEMEAAALDAGRLDGAAEAADNARAAADGRRRQAEAEASRLRADATANDGRAADVDASRAALVANNVLDDGEDAYGGRGALDGRRRRSRNGPGGAEPPPQRDQGPNRRDRRRGQDPYRHDRRFDPSAYRRRSANTAG